MSKSGCCNGSIFNHVRPQHHSRKSRTPLTKHSTEQQLKCRATLAELHQGRLGLGSTALQASSSAQRIRTLGSTRNSAEGCFYKLQAQPHTARQFSFWQLPNSFSQPEQNLPQGKPRDRSASPQAFHRNPIWDGSDSPASERGKTDKESSAEAAF